KGIRVEAAGMLNHILAKIADFEIDDASVVAQNAPSGFDISVWQMVAPLLRGGAVRVYPETIVRDPAAFLQAIDADGATILGVLPSFLRLLLQEIEGSEAPCTLGSLRRLILQAEPLPPSLVRRWYARYPKVALWNIYGLTETSDDVLHL